MMHRVRVFYSATGIYEIILFLRNEILSPVHESAVLESGIAQTFEEHHVRFATDC